MFEAGCKIVPNPLFLSSLSLPDGRGSVALRLCCGAAMPRCRSDRHSESEYVTDTAERNKVVYPAMNLRYPSGPQDPVRERGHVCAKVEAQKHVLVNPVFQTRSDADGGFHLVLRHD